MLGYNEMLSRIKPSKIICYGKPFDEMKGDIIEVDYAKTNNLQKSNSDLYIKTFYGYVDNTYRKGGGSASGQSSGNPEHEFDETLICRNFRDMKTKHRVKTMNGEAVVLMKIKAVGIILKPRKHCIGI